MMSSQFSRRSSAPRRPEVDKELYIPKNVFVVTGDNKLVAYPCSPRLPSSGWVKTVSPDCPLYLIDNLKSINSSIKLIGQYVFVVGGYTTQGKPSTEVYCFDMKLAPPYERIPAPSLLGTKINPTLIAIGSKLFAFSWVLWHCNPARFEPNPTCEVLDTGIPFDQWEWSPCSFPVLSPPSDDDVMQYSIVAYAAHEPTSTLFLSLGSYSEPSESGAVSLTYDYSLDNWSPVCENPLPFYQEGKFIGDLCYAFPCGIDDQELSYISCCQIARKWVDGRNQLYLKEITRYSLVSGQPLYANPYLKSFFIHNDKLVFTIVQAKAMGLSNGSSGKHKCHGLKIDLVTPIDIQTVGKNTEIVRTTKLLWSKPYEVLHGLEDIVGVMLCDR